MNIIDFKKKNECCGCSACVSICPQNAMHLQKDKYGFLYPIKDIDACVDCGLCEKVCSFNTHHRTTTYSKTAYAVVSRDAVQAVNSSSGGFFAKAAEYVLNMEGCVCGAAWFRENGEIRARHVLITEIEDVRLLQGSKYVQSEVGDCFKEVRSILEAGKKVLFSGTPCQVDGLLGFLQRDYDNLLTLDIVCHGVPNGDMLNDYFKYKWSDYTPKDICFRDKKMGWGMEGYVKLSKKGKEKTINISPKNSSYFSEFINGNLYRENCYRCPYAGENRPADISIGDFWGVMEEHQQYADEMNDAISAVIINSEKGKEFFLKMQDSLFSCKSSFERIARHNSQLREPSKYPKIRDQLLERYALSGYQAIEEHFRTHNSILGILKENLRLNLKSIIKSFRSK